MIAKQLRNKTLEWLSQTSGEEVNDWKRVSRGDIICFILNRLKPGLIPLEIITDGVDRFARVTNWRTSNSSMRKLGIGWDFDEVKLVMGDEMELFRLVKSIRRWETKYMEEPLQPLSPDEWNDDELPPWFTQYAAKKLEDQNLAAGESNTKKKREVVIKVDIRAKLKAERKSILEQMNLIPTK